ncbi:MAG TPA: hypothetical protein VMH37_18385, partial [Candidatus Binataceae bacterium]|nr:hypothetical protein [Candidatus Binataceae bacterium]
IKTLTPSEMRELEDFTREAIQLVMTGQFPKEAYEAIGMSPQEIEEIRVARKEIARSSNDAAVFRKLFRREMHQTIVTNMQKVGLLNDRTAGFLREMGVDPTQAAIA